MTADYWVAMAPQRQAVVKLHMLKATVQAVVFSCTVLYCTGKARQGMTTKVINGHGLPAGAIMP